LRFQHMNSSRYQVIVFSGPTEKDLVRKIESLLHLAVSESELRNAFYAESRFSPRGSARVGFVLKPGDKATDCLREALAAIQNEHSSERIVLGLNHPESLARRVCLLFPGLAVHYLGMGLSLEKHFAPAQRIFARANVATQRIFGTDISDLIAGNVSRDGLTPDATLTLSQFAYPAILTVSLAVLEILRSIGLKPSCAIGMSLGEYGALVSSGILAFEDAIKLAYESGRLALEAAIPGQMVAILTDRDTVKEVLAGINDHVGIANFNSPSQCVITGTKRGIEQAVLRFNEKSIVSIPLRISVGYHCELVRSSTDQFLPYLDPISWRSPLMEVYSTVGDSGVYPKKDIAEFAMSTVGNLLIEKVHFQQQVELAKKNGNTVFVDLGPSTVMADLVRHMGGGGVGLLRASEDELFYFMKSVLSLSMALPELEATRLNDIQIDDQS